MDVAAEGGDDVLPLLSPALTAVPGVMDSVRTTARLVPPGGRDTASAIGYQWWTSGGLTTHRVQYSYKAGGKFVIYEIVVMGTIPGSFSVAGFHVYVTEHSLASQNALTIGNASVAALLGSLVALFNVGLSLWAAVMVVRSRMPRRWLWALLACVGFGRMQIPWHGGDVNEQFIALQFFGAGFQRQGFIGPWWVYVSFPGGAILALQRLRKRAPAPVATQDAAPAAPITPA
jgi:hypothetical protein